MTQAANTDPRHGRAGRNPTRQFLDSLSGNVDPGLFGRTFPNRPPLTASDAQLQALADAMKDANPSDPGGDSNIPSGFTYLGQFVDHDITLDLTSIAEKQEDPLATTNFSTPRLDLDNVYGLGPDGSPRLDARDPANITQPGPKLLIGKTGTTSQVAGGISERPAAQPRGPRPDRRPSQRREPARGSSLSSNSTTRSSTGLPPAPIRRHRASSSPRPANRLPGITNGWGCTIGSSGSPKPGSSPRSCTRGGSSTGSTRCHTCRSSSRQRLTGSATAWCAKPIATITSSPSAAWFPRA